MTKGTDMTQEMLALPVQIQISLAAGFAAYAATYAGLRMRHRGQDAVIIIGIFSGISLFWYELGRDLPVVLQMSLAVAVPLLLGLGWRACYRDLWLWVMRRTGIHKDDGLVSAWDTLAVGWDRYEANQVLVYLKDGRELYLNVYDIEHKGKLPYGGLVLGQTGDILMCVTEEEFGDVTLKRQSVFDDTYGTRVTYIPAEQINRLELRVIPRITSSEVEVSKVRRLLLRVGL